MVSTPSHPSYGPGLTSAYCLLPDNDHSPNLRDA
jgi:hypothetical protein